MIVVVVVIVIIVIVIVITMKNLVATLLVFAFKLCDKCVGGFEPILFAHMNFKQITLLSDSDSKVKLHKIGLCVRSGLASCTRHDISSQIISST